MVNNAEILMNHLPKEVREKFNKIQLLQGIKAYESIIDSL